MDIRFSPHNTHLEKRSLFSSLDPQLRQLKNQALVYRFPLLDRLTVKTPGIYSISGGRQIGKTTLLKQWMAELLEKNIDPSRIVYFTGELIDDHHSLVRLITETVQDMPGNEMCYLLLDEVTYIRGWDKGVKFLADAGILEHIILMLTGSDTVLIKEARMRFPGRRGEAEIVDFLLHPLNFFEFINLRKRFCQVELEQLAGRDIEENSPLIIKLFEEFKNYMAHGGFLTAINDVEKNGYIKPSTLYTYSDWIRGDVLKRGKQDHYLREVLNAIVNRYGSQVTWNALSKDLSIDHPKTVADYVALLESMDVAFVQAAISEDKLSASPKKARKMMFTDPFIFHAIRAWLTPVEDPYKIQIEVALSDRNWSSRLAESCVATHYSRHYPTYYIKAKGEVDVAYVSHNRFWPVEVKWTAQIRPKDLKQVAKYSNSRILTCLQRYGEIMGVHTEPLPLTLFRLGKDMENIVK